ncbi:MAG: glycosyltransferase family 4 protein [Candidatus Parcubacteria bacterium]|nr:glycosyltransferase family 4 protein [Candidatus Parcubacteria bacterium]
MKISYIVNARIPTERAHGIQITKMAESFADLGFKTELILPRRRNPITEDVFKYYGLKENFEIKFLPCWDLITLDKYIGHLGLWIESMTFLISATFYIIFNQADIIYTRDVSLLPLTLFKKNVFLESHSMPRKYFLYAPFLRRLKGIIAITAILKKIFLEKGIKENKLFVAPDGVDLDEFDIKQTQAECRKRLNLPQEEKIIVYTGHLYKWKGVQILADSAEYLPENAGIYFIGGTKEDIKEFKSKNSVSNIKIVGHQSHTEIPYWLKAADILVLPNSAKEDISLYWTSPLKLFEYMAANRPIIASDLPSIREILNEDNSLLVPPDDVQKLGQALNRLLADQALSMRISNNAYREAKKYTWQKRARGIIEFILKQ